MLGRISDSKIKLSFVVYLFFYMFAPPLIPKVNMIFFVAAFSLFMLMTKYRNSIKSVLYKSKIISFSVMIFCAFIYIGLIMSIGVFLDPVNPINYIKSGYRFFLLVPVTLICIVYVILRAKELEYGLKEVSKALILAGLIQTLFSVSMALIPQFREFLLNIMYMNTGDSLSQNLWHIQRRYYAFSQNVLDTFGYGTGILAILPLFYGFYIKRYVYCLLTPILLIVPLLNSRTGLVIAFIGILCFLLYTIFKTSFVQLLKMSIITFFLALISIQAINYFSKILPTTMYWVNSGINDAIGFFKGEKGTDSVSIITSQNNWLLPDSYFIFFGTGHNVYEAKGYSHSDVGYVNDIWLSGILGFTFLYSSMVFLFLTAFFKRNVFLIRTLVVFLALSFFVTNIKTIILSYNVGTSIVLLLLFFIIYESNINNSDGVNNY